MPFNEQLADRAAAFIRSLKHTKGTWHGKNFDLLPWQEKIVRDVFGTVKENGYGQYNTAYVEIPKKQGKSELAAAIALYLLAGDGEYKGVENDALETVVDNKEWTIEVKPKPQQYQSKYAFPNIGNSAKGAAYRDVCQ